MEMRLSEDTSHTKGIFLENKSWGSLLCSCSRRDYKSKISVYLSFLIQFQLPQHSSQVSQTTFLILNPVQFTLLFPTSCKTRSESDAMFQTCNMALTELDTLQWWHKPRPLYYGRQLLSGVAQSLFATGCLPTHGRQLRTALTTRATHKGGKYGKLSGDQLIWGPMEADSIFCLIRP